MFDTDRFLRDTFTDADGVVGMLENAGFQAPLRDTARKWFSRSSVPSEWWPVLVIVVIETTDKEVDFRQYWRGAEHDIFG